jgi:Rap1a immunity proteins
MKKFATLTATAGLAATISTAASAYTANQLMPACRAFMTRNNQVEVDGGRYAIGLCAGIVVGLDYGLMCSTNKVTLEQAVRVVVYYIDQRPARWHEPFRDLALEGLRSAWPCNRIRVGPGD